jgi:hypothetical protein
MVVILGAAIKNEICLLWQWQQQLELWTVTGITMMLVATAVMVAAIDAVVIVLTILDYKDGGGSVSNKHKQ